LQKEGQQPEISDPVQNEIPLTSEPLENPNIDEPNPEADIDPEPEETEQIREIKKDTNPTKMKKVIPKLKL